MSTVNQGTTNTYIASGNIRPARILVRSASVARSAAEAVDTTTVPIGVSLNSYKFTNSIYDGSVYAYTAVANDPIPYAGRGQVAIVTAGAAITDLSLPVGSDSAARAVSITPTDEGTVAYALGYPLSLASAAGDLILVDINPQEIDVA